MWVYQIMSIFIMLLGGIGTAIQIFKMTILDAKSRGIKNPKLWAFLATSGQNGGGILLYLLKRRKYPSSMSTSDLQQMESYKKRVTVSLIFVVVGTIVLLLTVLWE